MLGSRATNAAGESAFDRRTENLKALTRDEVVQSRGQGEGRVLLDGHRLHRRNARNIHATHQCGSATGHKIDWGVVAIIQAPVTHQTLRVRSQRRIGLGNEFCRGHSPVPNPNLVDYAVESCVRPIAFADIAVLTTHRSWTVHGCRTHQATIKVQESSATAMHGRHVGPSVERQSFIGGQSITHTRSNDIEQGPTTGSLGEGQQDVIHARPVTEVEDAAVVLKAARINPTLDGEV